MLKLIFWIFVGILVLSFFGITLESIINSPAGQENIAYLLSILKSIGTWFMERIAALI